MAVGFVEEPISVSAICMEQEIHRLRTRLVELERDAARWIPVTERLPETEVTVLCYGPNTIHPDLPWIMFVDWRGSKPDFGCGVTHWMPLPAAPTGEPHDPT